MEYILFSCILDLVTIFITSTAPATILLMDPRHTYPVDEADANTAPPPLVDDALPVLRDVQSTITRILDSLPAPVTSSADLRKQLGLHKALGWNIYRLSIAKQPLEVGLYVPRPGTFQRFLDAARIAEIPTEHIDSAAHAAAAYELLVKRHAPDRSTFVTMIRDFLAADLPQEDLQHRRAAFRANRQLLGVHSFANIVAHIINKGAANDFDMVTTTGQVQIQRNRANATRLTRNEYKYFDPAKIAEDTPKKTDWSGDSNTGGTYLLLPFCSQPPPEIRSFPNEERRTVTTEFHARTIGSKGAVTFFSATVYRNVLVSTPPCDFYSYIHTPTEVMYDDFWIHSSIWKNARPAALAIWRRVTDEEILHNFTPDSSECLPLRTEVEDLGLGSHGGRLPEFPRYVEMVRHTADNMGWNIDEFRLFRCRIEYPIVASMLRIRWE